MSRTHRLPGSTTAAAHLRRLLLVAVACLPILVLCGPAVAQDVPPGGDPGTEAPPVVDPVADARTYEQLAACVSQNQKLLVVLLVDESGSLQQTDPENARVAAVQRALSGLAALTTASDPPPSVEVLLSVFSYDFQALGGWTPMTPETLPDLQAQADSLAQRNTGMDTDFTNALGGAREALSERAVEVGGGREVCKAVLLFTDGRLDIGVRRTDAQADRYGLTKDYAPGIVLDTPEAAARARVLSIAALCQPDGVADQVRGDRVTLLTAALSVALRQDDEEFLAAVTRGAAGDTTCGERSADGLGAYVSGADGTALLRSFDLVATQVAGGTPLGPPSPTLACADPPCGDGPVEVDIDASLRRVHVFVAVPDPSTEVLLGAPGEDDPLVLAERESGEVDYGGVTVRTAWLSPLALTIDIEDIGPEAFGTWTVSLRGDDGAGSVQVSVFADIVAALVATPVVERGKPVTFEASIQTRAGDPAADQIRSADVVVGVDDPVTGTSYPVPLTATAEGYSGTWEAPAELTSSRLSAIVRMDAVTVQGVRVSSVAAPVELTTRPPAGFPFVGPATLVLSSVTGDGSAEGDLIVIADGESCVWVDGVDVDAAPTEVQEVLLTVSGLGRSEGDCTSLEEGDRLDVPLELDPGVRASGTVRGALRVWATTADADAPVATDIPLSFEMTRGVDEAKRLILATVLLAVGLLVPLGLLLVMNLLSTRFQSMDRVRGTRVPVEVSELDDVIRTDGRQGMMRLVPRDFVSLAGAGGSKSFTFAGLEFRARTSLNPFRAGHAVAAPAEGVADVARAARRVELDLALAGSWIFLYDPDATDAASAVPEADGNRRRRIRGHIVAFINEGPQAPQTTPMVSDIFHRLPGIARELDHVAAAAAAKGRGGARRGRGGAVEADGGEPEPDEGTAGPTDPAPAEPDGPDAPA